MEKIFIIDNKEIHCKIFKRSKKNIVFRFNKDILHISTPKYFPMKDLKLILDKRKEWIFENINKIRNKPEQIFFLGKEFLSIDEIVPYYNSNYNQSFTQIDEIIPHLITSIFKKNLNNMNQTINLLKIKKMKSAWGICYRSKNITLNSLLVCCPIDVINYVIIHELCHLIHMNHSKSFWNEVSNYCPQYTIQKKWLKEHNSLIMNQSYL